MAPTTEESAPSVDVERGPARESATGRSWKQAAVAVVLWAMAVYIIATSARGLHAFITVDEDVRWHGNRVLLFWRALLDGDFSNEEALRVCDKPGLTTAWAAGGAYLLTERLSPFGAGPSGAGDDGYWSRAFTANRPPALANGRKRIRAVQRLACYATCVALFLIIATTLSAAHGPTPNRSGTRADWLVPFLVLIALATPAIRMHARIVLPDGLMASFGLLSVALMGLGIMMAPSGRQYGVLFASGACSALSLLSKYSGFFVLAYLLVVLFCWSLAVIFPAVIRPAGRASEGRAFLGIPPHVLGATKAPVLRVGAFVVGLLLFAYAFQPYAWMRPAAALVVFEPLMAFVRLEDLWRYALGVVVLLVGGCLAVFVMRNRAARRGRTTDDKANAPRPDGQPSATTWLFVLGCSAASLLATGFVIALIWQRDHLVTFAEGNVPEGFDPAGAYVWRCRNIYTYHAGRLASHLFHLKRIFIFVATTTPLYLLVPTLAGPWMILCAWRRRHDAGVRRAMAGVALILGFLAVQVLAYNAQLFPVQTRYLLLVHVGLTLYVGMLVMLAWTCKRAWGTALVLLVAACACVVHAISLPYNLSFVNCLRSRTIENAYEERADGTVQGTAVCQETGANLVHFAEFLNESYDAADNPKQQAQMRVLTDYPGFDDFYHGPSEQSLNLLKPFMPEYRYVVVTRPTLRRNPAARFLVRKQKPIRMIRHQGVELAWLFEFDAWGPTNVAATPTPNVVTDGTFERAANDPNWRTTPVVVANERGRCAKIVENWRARTGALTYACPSDFAHVMDVSFWVKPIDSAAMTLGMEEWYGAQRYSTADRDIPLRKGEWQEVRQQFPVLWGPYEVRLTFHAIGLRTSPVDQGEMLLDDVSIRFLRTPGLP